MRVLAALAALHVILACSDGQCDEVEMLQSSVSQVKDSATFQLSAMVHGGKHKSKPEAKQSAVSAHSPQPAKAKKIEEKSAQLAEEKPAEEKSPQPAEAKKIEEKSAQLAEEKPAEEKSPQPAEEKEIEEKSAQLAEEKPAEEKSPQPAEEEPAKDRPAEDPEESEEDESPQSAKEKEIEEKLAHLAEEKPAEEKSPRSAEEEPAKDRPAEDPEESEEDLSPQSAKEKEIEEKLAHLAEGKPAEEKSHRSAEEEPAKDAEEESPQAPKEKEIEEKSAQLAEEKPAEKKPPRSAEEEPAEDAGEELWPDDDAPAEEKPAQLAQKKPAEGKSPQSAKEKEEIQKKVDWNKMMEIALLLARARDNCKDFAGGPETCLGLLKDYRRHAWPYIEKELGKNLTFFKVKGPQGMKNGWRPFFLKTRLRGCVEHPVIYMQVMGVKANNVVTNLRKHSNRPSAIKTGYIDNGEICRATKNKKTVGVTFVRDPLERFISAYEELVTFHRNRPNWAKRHAAFLGTLNFLEEEESSTENARLFIETFLQGRGQDITASILPQVEYFLETAQNCSARISFVGKSESPADEWQRMIHDMGCDPAKIPYLNATATHPPGSPGKHPLRKHPLRSPGKNGTKANKTSSLLQVSSGATSSIQKVLKQHNGAYLRAWCWFSMPDYVLLKYDLPAECQDLLDGFVV